MFSCIGRRVSLLRSFRQAAQKLGLDCRIIGTDTRQTSPALHCCDQKYVVRPVKERGYAAEITRIIQKEKVDLLVPTVDLDLAIWARQNAQLKKVGCTVLISKPGVIKICQDKRLTFDFLKKHDFGTPCTLTPQQALKEKKFPYFLKPWDGHASRGNALVNDLEELKFYAKRIPNCLVQEFIDGQEHTVDVLIDFDGEIRCIVPRRRIETRSGEVSKGITAKNPIVIQQCKELIEALAAGPGVVTIQCFVTLENKVKFIEINPRFGGGVPLSIKAGANFPRWIIQWWLGQNPKIKPDAWQDNLLMLRYDDAVWVPNKGTS